jgi:hypothetical protein
MRMTRMDESLGRAGRRFLPTKRRLQRSLEPTEISNESPRLMAQKALIVRTGPEGHDGLKELNVELERGWRVVRVTAMGGAGDVADEAPTHAALVVLEREDRDQPSSAAAVAALEEIGKESEEVVEQVVEEADEIVEGNGAEPLDESSM